MTSNVVEYLCDYCNLQDNCEFAYDEYNKMINGKNLTDYCLADK